MSDRIRPQPLDDDLVVDPRQVERIVWAREMLRVPSGVGGPNLQALLLRRLADCDLVPTPSWRESVAVLAQDGWETNDLISTVMYQRKLREEIEEFAERFFKIPVPQRRAQWNSLVERSKGLPQARERLNQLSGGLLVDTREVRCEGAPREVIDTVLRLFVLPTSEQAQLRRNKLAQYTEDPAYQAAAQIVRDSYPKIAGLSYLVDPVADAAQRARQRKKVIHRRAQLLDREEMQQAKAPSRSSGWLAVIFPVVLLVLSGVARLAKSPSKPTNTPAAVPGAREVWDERWRRDAERFSREQEVQRPAPPPDIGRIREDANRRTQEALDRARRTVDEDARRREQQRMEDDALRKIFDRGRRAAPP